MDNIKNHQELIRQHQELPKVEKALGLATKKIELSAYRNERNLMLYPLCSTSRRKRTTSINYQSTDGKRWLTVSANAEFGMAKIWDFDVLKFALSKAGEIARMEGSIFPPYIEFTAYECLKALGRNPKGKTAHNWLSEALDRLASTVYSGNIFRENEKVKSTFTLIKVESTEEKYVNSSRIRILFDERLIESARYAKGLLEIDYNIIKEDSGLRKRIIELINTSIGKSKEWAVSVEKLQALCAHEGKIKEFKRQIKSLENLPWEMSFSAKVGGGEKVTFIKN